MGKVRRMHNRARPGAQSFARPLGKQLPSQDIRPQAANGRRFALTTARKTAAWDAGLDVVEVEVQRARTVTHKFEPLGERARAAEVCRHCLAGRDELAVIEGSERKIHPLLGRPFEEVAP